MIQKLYLLMRTALYAVVAAAVLLASYGAWSVVQSVRARDAALAAKERQIQKLNHQIAEQEREIQRLQTAMELLKNEHRVARIEVVSQVPSLNHPGEVETTLRFVEIGPQGQILGSPQTMTILGKVAYIDALLIKFQDRYVEMGDELRGTSVCLFRRVFGEYQQPQQGYHLDTVGSRPRAYSPGSELTPFERELWSRFWDYANDPVLAGQAGVRAMHVDAVGMELRPGKVYRLDLRASGGLTIRPETSGRGAEAAS